MTGVSLMRDSALLAGAPDGNGRMVWLSRLDDGSLHLSDVEGSDSSDHVRSGLNLLIPAASVDQLAFMLVLERFRGSSRAVEELRDLLSAEGIRHFFENTR
jgi:hypothetical protein